MVLFAAFTQFNAITTVCLLIYLSFYQANIYSQEDPNGGELFRPSNNPTLNIPIEGGANSLAINPNANKTYIGTTNEQLVITNDSSGIVLGNVTLENSPKIMAVNPSNNRIYIATENSNNITVIDDSANRTKDFLNVGLKIEDIKVNPSLNKTYISFADGKRISVFDEKSDTIRSIYGNYSYIGDRILVDDKKNLIYVINSEQGRISIIDSNLDKVIKTNIQFYELDEDEEFTDFDLKSDDDRIYIATKVEGIVIHFAGGETIFNNRGGILIIEGSKLLESYAPDIKTPSIKVADEPNSIAVDSIFNKVYVSHPKSDSISILDGKTDKLIGSIEIKNADKLYFNQNDNKTYLTTEK